MLGDCPTIGKSPSITAGDTADLPPTIGPRLSDCNNQIIIATFR